MTRSLSALFLASAFLLAAAQPQPVRIATETLPSTTTGEYYNAQLDASGGVRPYKWALVAGTLPPGLNLDSSGLLLGTSTSAGSLRFTVRVTDSSNPPQTATRVISAEVKPALSLVWKSPPRLENGGIFGSVVFANNLRQPVDLTLIIVAVNEFNKSNVLGYQHATIAPRTATPVIPFGFTLPRGSYIVHADAYAERPNTGALLHTRMQTSSELQVP